MKEISRESNVRRRQIHRKFGCLFNSPDISDNRRSLYLWKHQSKSLFYYFLYIIFIIIRNPSLFLEDYCIIYSSYFNLCIAQTHTHSQVACPFFCCAFTSTFSCTQLSPMASLIAVSQTQLLYIKPRLVSPPHQSRSLFLPTGLPAGVRGVRAIMPRKAVIVSAATAETPKKKGESKGFVEEMRFVAMRLHTRDQAKEGEKEVKQPEEKAVTKWDPTVEGYLKFLVDSKVVYDTLEDIVQEAPHPSCECRFSPWIF